MQVPLGATRSAVTAITPFNKGWPVGFPYGLRRWRAPRSRLTFPAALFREVGAHVFHKGTRRLSAEHRILERHALRIVLGARAARLLRASLYKTSAVSEADSFAEVIGLATGIGSDPDLVERASPSTAK
jgi:hypothetical protein